MMSIARLAMAKDANSVSNKVKDKIAAAPREEKKPEKATAAAAPTVVKKEETKQEDIAAGLGSLFG
jgi:ribosomal protein L12E/L44/L45/RPP1/RPP2